MQKKIHMSSADLESHVHTIIRQIVKEQWRPDYIVGLTRGGLEPANMISQYLDIPMHALDVSLRDKRIGPTSCAWMSEDAYNGMQILIVDDINDTGATLQWIHTDWANSCLPTHDTWDAVFGNNVRFATIVNNEASNYQNVSYTSLEINKAVEDVWIVFPWENWWKRKHTQ